MTIGNKIRILRQGRNMTRNELAEKTGLAEITIKQYEADKYLPRPKQIVKLAAALNVSPDDINTENYWKYADNYIIPNYYCLNNDFSFAALQKEKAEKRNFVIKAIKKKDFYSDLTVDVIMRLLALNENGQCIIYEFIQDISKFPEYQKNSDGEKVG